MSIIILINIQKFLEDVAEKNKFLNIIKKLKITFTLSLGSYLPFA